MEEYAVEIKYHCYDYGGALINYKLEVDVPGCGKSAVYWKKLCGNPILTRDGLNINMENADKNISLVQDGKNSLTSLYDKEIE